MNGHGETNAPRCQDKVKFFIDYCPSSLVIGMGKKVIRSKVETMNFVALVADCFISTIWHHFLGQVRPNAKWSPRLALFTSFYSLGL